MKFHKASNNAIITEYTKEQIIKDEIIYLIQTTSLGQDPIKLVSTLCDDMIKNVMLVNETKIKAAILDMLMENTLLLGPNRELKISK